MPIPYPRVEELLQRAGLRSFTKRKLQRWATPVVEVRDADGTIRRLGLLSGGTRRGKGRGAGVEWLLSESDMLVATFIQYALDRMEARTLAGHTLGDAGLWAFLWGAPVPLPVARYYMIESLTKEEQRVTELLQSRKQSHEDEMSELVDALARDIAYDYPVDKAGEIPVPDRQRWGQEALSAWIGMRWSSGDEASEFYSRFTESYLKKITKFLSGSEADMEQFFDQTPDSQVEQELRFYSFENLRELYRNSPNEWLMRVQATFSTGQRFLDAVSDALQSKKPVPATVMSRAKDLRAFYTMLAHLLPGTVVSLLLWQHAHSPKQEGHEPANP